ncbi:MAG: glycerophosphoryl diester phosphodiesterase [Gammaproteobacteria bacterium]|jgi:glycerophosphoryl diester phosphodiesterase
MARLLAFLQQLAQIACDFLYGILPRPKPSQSDLLDCKIISHRGEHDNRCIFENTLTAFDLAVQAGAWGIEFDIRCDQNGIPLVIHDDNCRRVFGRHQPVSKVTLCHLRADFPDIPTLSEVLDRYNGQIHFMIEIKPIPTHLMSVFTENLNTILSAFEPGVDYHVLALESELFELANFVPKSARLPVAELNLNRLANQAIEEGFAGISGHYLLLNKTRIRSFQHRGQKIGTGFARNRFTFYREISRRVDWIFTNHAVKLCRLRQGLIEKK